jgi:hypothetical protein
MFDMKLNEHTIFAVIRMLRKGRKWHYRGVVHEILTCDDDSKIAKNKLIGPSFYQDRVDDNYKTYNRNFCDRDLLIEEMEKNSKDSRSCFFLARTYLSLSNKEYSYKYYSHKDTKFIEKWIYDNLKLSYKYFKKRVELGGPHFEEIFSASLHCGFTSVNLGYDWECSYKHFLDTYKIIPRVEPLYYIALDYSRKGQHTMAYMYIKLACTLPYPDKSALFIDFNIYNRERYLLMVSIALPMFQETIKGSNDINKAKLYLYEGRDYAVQMLDKLDEEPRKLLMRDLEIYDNVIKLTVPVDRSDY